MKRALAALAFVALLCGFNPTPAGAVVDEAVVQGQARRLYSAYFLRQPDLSGLRFWVGELNDGMSLQNVSEFFAQSEEFGERYGSLDDGQFVDLVYTNVLGRLPDAKGRAHWVTTLSTGKNSRGGVMLGFSGSPEYVTKTGTTPPRPSRSFGDGTYDGADVAGTWRNVTNLDGCYWERLSGWTSSEEDVIASDWAEDGGRFIVTIEASDLGFQSTSCGTWVPDVGPITLSPFDPFAQGSYRVHRDIAPGTWRSDAGTRDCYWERLSGFTGEVEQIIDNNFGNGPMVVEIADSDVGFKATEDCGVWVKIA